MSSPQISRRSTLRQALNTPLLCVALLLLLHAHPEDSYAHSIPHLHRTVCDSAQTNDSALLRDMPIDQVVVTGSRTQRALKNVPTLTRVISQREIAIINPRSVNDLLLNAIPGIEITSHMGLKRMTIQGLGANYFLFLIDGAPLTMEGNNAVDLERIGVANIERIEYVPGSGSSLYGSKAIGGVINIITKKNALPIEASYQGAYYTYSHQLHAATLGGNWRGLTSSTEGSLGLCHDYSIPAGQNDQGQQLTATVPGFLTWTAGERLDWHSKNYTWRTKAHGNFYRQIQNHDQIRKRIYQSIRAGGSLHYSVTKGHSLQASYQGEHYNRNDWFFTARPEQHPLQHLFTYYTHNARLQYDWEPKAHRMPQLNAGYELLAEGLNATRLKDTNRVYYAFNHTLYLQLYWKPWPALALSGGVRVDLHSSYEAHITPQLAILWRIQGFSLRASYAQGFRSPNLKELHMDWDHMGMFQIQGNPRLKPEESHMFILAPEYSNPQVDLTFSASYCLLKQRIVFENVFDNTVRAGQAMRYTNTAGWTQILALNAMLRLKLGAGFTESINYCYVKDLSQKTMEEGSLVAPEAMRPHTLTLATSFSHQYKSYNLVANLSGRYLGPVDFPTFVNLTLERIRYEGALLLKLALTQWWENHVGLTLGIDNLLDYQANKKITLATNLSPGRNYFVALSLHY